MIKHMVFFKLSYAKNSIEEKEFFSAAASLASIDGVQHFESLKQISNKNNFDYGLSMEFANEGLYKQYNEHPLHVEFIQDYWLPFVIDFIEIDHEPLVK